MTFLKSPDSLTHPVYALLIIKNTTGMSHLKILVYVY